MLQPEDSQRGEGQGKLHWTPCVIGPSEYGMARRQTLSGESGSRMEREPELARQRGELIRW